MDLSHSVVGFAAFLHFFTSATRATGDPVRACVGGPVTPGDAGTMLGVVFVHQAPLSRPLEVARRACSTSRRTRSGSRVEEHKWIDENF